MLGNLVSGLSSAFGGDNLLGQVFGQTSNFNMSGLTNGALDGMSAEQNAEMLNTLAERQARDLNLTKFIGANEVEKKMLQDAISETVDNTEMMKQLNANSRANTSSFLTDLTSG